MAKVVNCTAWSSNEGFLKRDSHVCVFRILIVLTLLLSADCVVQ